jgi:hypothetical protein
VRQEPGRRCLIVHTGRYFSFNAAVTRPALAKFEYSAYGLGSWYRAVENIRLPRNHQQPHKGKQSMSKTHTNTLFPKAIKSVLILLVGSMLAPMAATADTAEEIEALIMQDNADSRANLAASGEGISKHGSLEFWSSGGLMQYVPTDAPGNTWDHFALTPKHIKVVTLVEDQAAVAMYYSEGSFHETGQQPVSHYMTRVTIAFVKEDGEWKQRAAHFSPIAAGQGTRQTALD